MGADPQLLVIVAGAVIATLAAYLSWLGSKIVDNTSKIAAMIVEIAEIRRALSDLPCHTERCKHCGMSRGDTV